MLSGSFAASSSALLAAGVGPLLQAVPCAASRAELAARKEKMSVDSMSLNWLSDTSTEMRKIPVPGLGLASRATRP